MIIKENNNKHVKKKGTIAKEIFEVKISTSPPSIRG